LLEQLLDLAHRGAWLALAAAVIGLLALAAKQDRLGGLFSKVPVRQRPRVIAALGVLAGILDAVVRGTPWAEAITSGILSGGLAMLVHGVAGGVNPQVAPAVVLPAPGPVVDTVIADLDVEPGVGGDWGPK
jgi:hypothetical protein